MTYDLGMDADDLVVRLHRDARFEAEFFLLDDDTFAPGTEVELRFPTDDTVWAATVTGGAATWSVPSSLTNLRSSREPAELWVGDECWAAGRVRRRG